MATISSWLLKMEAHCFNCNLFFQVISWLIFSRTLQAVLFCLTKQNKEESGDAGDWTRGLSHANERSTTELHPLNTHSGQGGFSDIFTWSHGKARWLSTKVWRHRPSRLPWGRECLSDHFWGNLCDGTCFFQRAGRKLLTGTYKDGWGLVVYLCWLHRKFVKKKKYWLESKSALSGVGFEPTPGRPDCDLNAAP